ncbi:MAG: hypothetical protein WC869_02030 [Phycisphaerae bacterium]
MTLRPKNHRGTEAGDTTSALTGIITEDAADLLHMEFIPRYMDRRVYGHGVEVENGKYDPRFANPTKDAPQRYVKVLQLRFPLELGRRKCLQHVSGFRPFFQMNMAYREREDWVSEGFLVQMMMELGIFPGKATFKVVRDMLADKKGRLTLDEAKSLLRVSPSSAEGLAMLAKIKGKSRLHEVKRALLAVEPDSPQSRLVRRNLNKASGLRFEPITIHELVIDIDADWHVPGAHAQALAMAGAICDGILRPAGYRPFIEKSRNGHGVYIRFRVQRLSTDPEEFNTLVGLLMKYLRGRFGGKVEGSGCWVDKVGGLLAYHRPNPKFNSGAYDFQEAWLKPHQMTDGEYYDWCKRRADLMPPPRNRHEQPQPVAWTYDPKMERYELRCGDLIPLPLHNLPSDMGGGKARLQDYADYMDDPRSLVPESYLRELVRSELAANAPLARSRRCRSPIPAAVPSASSSAHGAVIEQELSEIPSGCLSRDHQIYLKGDGQFPRYGAAARIVVRKYGPDGAPLQMEEEMLCMVEAPGGPATDERHPGRERQVSRQLDYWIDLYDPDAASSGGDASVWFDYVTDLDWAEERVRGRVSRKMLDKAHKDHPWARLSYRLLAAGLLWMLKNIHSGNLGEVPRDSLVKGLRDMELPHDTSIVAAIIELLTAPHARLIVPVQVDGVPGYGRGRCRRFAMHPECPIPTWLSQSGCPLQFDHPAPSAVVAPVSASAPVTAVVADATMSERDVHGLAPRRAVQHGVSTPASPFPLDNVCERSGLPGRGTLQAPKPSAWDISVFIGMESLAECKKCQEEQRHHCAHEACPSNLQVDR